MRHYKQRRGDGDLKHSGVFSPLHSTQTLVVSMQTRKIQTILDQQNSLVFSCAKCSEQNHGNA